ncbi:uncharacterized protein B0J16DRAFT_395594 [Fusarium flagelliforme]|uniref:uncharacterized protein n=1 Tax=Fusarium flagelliforme TaxID=2675880 RepID=UPI001E8E2499|nr:uncharacterized protein B0J16DRAFT_395594 [Fusarium flagelliforme]KAH7193687.1 hypothetical protein B0J16DRAFT_395594 [Fusarium flagelliforme]
MGDHVDEDMVRAALMADLGRLRQEELPLSDEAKRGPSFTPNNRNDTDQYTRHRKYQLSTKWGSKIEDDETRQMQGLEIQDARPWARGRVAEALSKKTINSGPPPRVGPREPKKGGNSVVFRPPQQAWKDCVDSLPKNSREESPAVIARIKAEGSGGDATNCTPTIPLIFTLHANELYSDALELVVGSGHCQVVPSKHEALSFLCRVELLINDKKGGILALHSQQKGSQVHNVLDIDKPAMDGKYCVFKAKSKEWPYNLRFDTLEHGKTFRSCLSKLKKAALYHQEPVKAEPVTANPVASKSPIAAEEDVSVVSKTIFDAASLDTAADTSVLIPMDGKWQTPRNTRVSQLEPAVTRMVPLVRDILERFMAEDTIRTGTIAGIEDAIFEKWIDEGFLKECDEKEREGSLAIIRALVDMRLIFSGEKRGDQLVKSSLNQEGYRAEEKGTTHEQANGSAKQSERKATKGLSASCFAKAPFACANAFTGPRSHPPYK